MLRPRSGDTIMVECCSGHGTAGPEKVVRVSKRHYITKENRFSRITGNCPIHDAYYIGAWRRRGERKWRSF